MIDFRGGGILLDIEGTTSSIRFVYDEMFPFARRELASYLEQDWADASAQEACERIAIDAGHADLATWCAAENVDPGDAGACRQLVRDEVERLMDQDIKATGLKQLQGLIWKSGFLSGELKAHLYDDVPPALRAWKAAGKDLRIYSSGSIAAQQLFFAHTEFGNLLDLFSAHYDTTTGGKKEAASYQIIAEQFRLPPAEILFLSDNLDELQAAEQAGLATGLCVRPGNQEITTAHSHRLLHSFAEVRVGA